jgi:autotransporter family porin
MTDRHVVTSLPAALAPPVDHAAEPAADRPGRRPARRGAGMALAVLLVVLAVGVVAPANPADAAVTTPVPSRVLDTRSGVGGFTGLVRPGRTVRLALPAAASAGATSVALNVTATDAARDGFVVAWPCGESKPATSVLNFVPGRAVANLVMLRLGQGGVCLTSNVPVHLVADLMSWFTGAGDFRGISPNRLLDTRRTGNPLRAGTVRRVRVAGTPGVPTNAAAAALNLTAVGPARDGYITAYPCNGSGRPGSSTMNFGGGQTVASLSVSALADRDVCVYAHVDTHLVVDAYGWLPSGGGLRVKPPARVLDTRERLGAVGIVRSGGTVRLRVAGRGGVPNTAQAALLTVTGVDARNLGFVTAWPCDAPMPVASVLNLAPGSSRANLALVKLSAAGEVCLRPKMSGAVPLHLVADAVGWVPGNVNRPPPPPETTGFKTLPVGAALPSGATCASRVRPTAENRPGNQVPNHTRGTRPNGRYPRVDGNFVGTTDEILQWVACKWGIDEDVVRAQAARESWWHQSTKGDLTSNQNNCHPQLRTGSGQCPESIGLLQVRYQYHLEAFQDANAIRSSAYNADYAYAVWRSCFEGKETWLNNVEHGATYRAGDLEGCLGVWFSGRYRTSAALGYISRVNDYLVRRVWETPEFAFG